MRLIDLDSLIAGFNKRCCGECCGCEEDYCGSGNDGCGCRVIDEAPTVDAVEVVRCRDCKWYHNANDKYFPRTCDHWSEMFYHYEDWESVDENGFCSWGERKDEVTECTTHT